MELSLELLVEEPAHLVRRAFVLRIEHPRQAEVRRHERPIAGDLAGEADRGAVDVAHLIRISDRRELLFARIEGEGLQDLRARVEELLVQLLHGGGMLEDDLRRERPGLNVAALLEFEQVATIAQDNALSQLPENPRIPGAFAPASPFLAHARREGRRRLIV